MVLHKNKRYKIDVSSHSPTSFGFLASRELGQSSKRQETEHTARDEDKKVLAVSLSLRLNQCQGRAAKRPLVSHGSWERADCIVGPQRM